MSIDADMCVIGGGAGGLVVAAGAAQLGARTVLIEGGRMGGDCLNYGCVPSKALLAAAHAAEGFRAAGRFGLAALEPRVDFTAVMAHVEDVVAAIAPHDSEERFTGLGVDVIRAMGRFTGPDTVEAGGQTVRARRFVIATGSSPLVPPIPGLERTPHLTNETIWDNRILPAHLIVIGGGPIGVELAQAHHRLGARVTLLEMGRLLPKDDPELARLLAARLAAEGIGIREGATVTAVEPIPGGVAVTAGEERIEGSHLLVAVGRVPNVAALDLDRAGIRHGRRGIEVDAQLRTSNRRVYAIGDAAGGPMFTHVSSYHAGLVIRNALFRLRAKVDHRAIPWVTYSDPELAHVGLTEAAARRAGEAINVLRFPLAENHRAQAERDTVGLIKVVTTPRGKVLGATILGARGGELILPWCLAIRAGLGVASLAGVVVPYPTRSEITKSVAGSFFVPKLFSERTRRLVRLLLKLP